MEGFYKKRSRRAKTQDTGKSNTDLIPAATRRMQADHQELELPSFCSIKLDGGSDLMSFTIDIRVNEGMWNKATYGFKFVIPEDYPHEPPKVTCIDKIYHPNIDLNGAVCLNILKEDWRPILSVQNVVHGLIFLFVEPNPADPLNHEAAAVYRQDLAQFKRHVLLSLKGGRVAGVDFPRNRSI